MQDSDRGIDIAKVIGQRYIFGRRIPLWKENSWQVEPIGTLQLTPEGLIEDYRHHNESVWRSVPGGFAFISHAGMVTSTWLHETPEGILLGRLNGGGGAPGGLCLVPVISQLSFESMIVLVASSMSFHSKTIPRIVPQLLAAGFEKERIKIVVNDAKSFETKIEDGIEYCYTPHSAWEFSAFYEAVRWEFSYTFVIPDTVTVLPSCRGKIEEINSSRKWDCYPVLANGRYSIGLFSRQLIQKANKRLAELDGITRYESFNFEASGGVLQYAESAFALQADCEKQDDASVIEGGAMRKTFYFKSLGIFNHVSVEGAYHKI